MEMANMLLCECRQMTVPSIKEIRMHPTYEGNQRESAKTPSARQGS